MSKNKSELKFWFILLENINYNAEAIFNIASQNSINDLEKYYNFESVYDEWINNGCNIQKYMIYNISFLENIEKFLISNGIFFNWIKHEDKYIGIRIHPTKIDFTPILKDCMDFKQFSKNRAYMNIPKNKKKEK